ncbi:OmpA family protein [Luteolibacter flavescens]|uniref:OmpA family protein n=1 Tax=Luteolibacter flavescens TaxID=1859460 RepID=A0ABT3FWB5_9BACT|nr:OmpA family protein [Luteolibacter flavescens]MCW1887609.1 OmpA family protein [Luteolibacter flavescens]
MNEQPAAPEPEKHAEAPEAAESTSAPKAATTPLPNSVLALGFVVIALVGILIAMAMKSRPAGTSADAAGDPALREQKAQLEILQSSINQERAKLGLTPLYGDTTRSADEAAERIIKDTATLVDLTKAAKGLIADKDAELDKRNQELADTAKLLASRVEQINKLQADLNRALIDGSDASGLRTQLDAASQRVIALTDEVRRLSQGNGALAQITAERDQLLIRVAELEALISQASLFAGSESELLEDGVQLFRQLRSLEDKPTSDIADAYSQFGALLGANVVDKISFPTGAADIAPDLQEKIVSFPGLAPDNALLLVVGYASETGDVDSNRALSSDRATAVARVLNQVKKPGQRVQAVYLGQTDRFGANAPELNQISEVWQIVPKADGSESGGSIPVPVPVPVPLPSDSSLPAPRPIPPGLGQ